MSIIPHHHTIPIRWSLGGLRQIMGQEIAHVTGDMTWAHSLPGIQDIWDKLMRASGDYPRIEVWQGPWLLLSDVDVLSRHIAEYQTASESDAVALREAAWFWRALGWGAYAGPTTWAIQSFLSLDVWPDDFWMRVDRIPPRPVRDWLRLERRVLFLRVAIDKAARGQAETPWGTGHIDCRPLLLS
jgi:hypothetical protein